MPLFQIANDLLTPISEVELDSEKRLQRMIEKSLDAAFKCRFIASEFSTGATHAGRIDTLAISEENNPVIVEYKKVESSDLINQSLFYLSWLSDHRGDFEIAARNKLGPGVEIDWSDIRVICLAPNYKRYDLHAVQVMGAIDLAVLKLEDTLSSGDIDCSVTTLCISRRSTVRQYTLPRQHRKDRKTRSWWPLEKKPP